MSQENEILIVDETSLGLSLELQKDFTAALQAKILEESSEVFTQKDPEI